MADPNLIDKDETKLAKAMQLAVTELHRRHKFKVVEGLRTLERQKMLKAAGKSKTLKSLHLLGMAVDIYPLPNGYRTKPEDIKKIQDDWKLIASKFGYPKTDFISWDPLHFSLNNGKNI